MTKKRVILDTNILISRLLKPDSTIASIVRAVTEEMVLLASQASFDELHHVIHRFVAKRYMMLEEAAEFLAAFSMIVEWVPVIERISACRDPHDNKFLELAVNGQADYLITGDQDLLILHPFRDTRILSPKDFWELVLGKG